MSYRLPSHLHRNRHGVLYFRLAVPADIRHLVGQREIYRSLGTSSVRRAMDTARTLRIAFSALFTDLAMPDDKNNPLDPLEAFARLPDVRLRLKHAGMKIALEEQREEIEKRELELGMKEAQMASMSERHERDLDIAIRVAAHLPQTITQPRVKATPTIMKVWEQYKAEKIAGGLWKDGENSARREHEPHVRTFCAAIGDDKQIGDVTHEDVTAFVGYVLRERPDESASNKEKRITRAGALFRWAKGKRIISDDFDELFKFTGKIPKNSRLKFSPEDLKRLFESVDFKENSFERPSEYWIPTLALFTGARLNELAQLRKDDIAVHEGIPTISVLDEDGKRLKNEASRRIVPIHSKLIQLGFLEYVGRAESGRIFPELTEARERPGDFGRGPSRRFTDYRRRLGVGTDKFNAATGKWEGKSRQDFHSFRTTFIDALRKAQPPVPKERRERIVGHESEGTNNKHYDGGDQMTMYSFATLKADVESAVFDVDFTAYRRGRG